MEKVETLRPSKTKKTAQTPMKNLNLTTSNPNKQGVEIKMSPSTDTPTPDFLVPFFGFQRPVHAAW